VRFGKLRYGFGDRAGYDRHMQTEITRRDEAEQLIVLHGAGAIGKLVSRIADAVRHCDDPAVKELDHILQLVEAKLEESWRRPAVRNTEAAVGGSVSCDLA
jgi:hypothetical protein